MRSVLALFLTLMMVSVMVSLGDRSALAQSDSL
jgi:hypothetical protein